MNKEQIAKRARKLKDSNDLMKLLNEMKKADMEEMGYGDLFRPFTKYHFDRYCNPNNTFRRYKEFKIKKKSGGYRTISAPRTKNFMSILLYLNEIFKALYTPSEYAMGFTEGRSVVNNAEVHVGQNYIFNIDLKDFFPSIDQARVWKRLQLPPFNFPKPVCNVIAGFCAIKTTRQREDGTKEECYALPQGAPTSPILTNMIAGNLDRKLSRLAKNYGLKYSRYADDITLSSMHNVYQKDSKFMTRLKQIVKDEHFRINEGKTRLQKRHQRQEVTGIIVSDKLNVTRKYVRDIRNLLYIWDKYGLTAASAKFYPKYQKEKGHVKKGSPGLINVLGGKLQYLKMVKGEEDSVYTRLFEKYSKLLQEATAPENKTAKGITYMETKAIPEFEEANGVVDIVISEAYTEIVEDADNPGQTKEIEHKAHRHGSFVFGGKKCDAKIYHILSNEDLKNKDMLDISLCRDIKNKTFWLIHKRKKKYVATPKPVDVEELNNELDLLLNI